MAGFNSLLIRRVQVSSNGEKDGKNLDWVQLFAPLKSLHLTPLLKMPPRKSVEIQYYFFLTHIGWFQKYPWLYTQSHFAQLGTPNLMGLAFERSACISITFHICCHNIFILKTTTHISYWYFEIWSQIWKTKEEIFIKI